MYVHGAQVPCTSSVRHGRQVNQRDDIISAYTTSLSILSRKYTRASLPLKKNKEKCNLSPSVLCHLAVRNLLSARHDLPFAEIFRLSLDLSLSLDGGIINYRRGRCTRFVHARQTSVRTRSIMTSIATFRNYMR